MEDQKIIKNPKGNLKVKQTNQKNNLSYKIREKYFSQNKQKNFLNYKFSHLNPEDVKISSLKEKKLESENQTKNNQPNQKNELKLKTKIYIAQIVVILGCFLAYQFFLNQHHFFSIFRKKNYSNVFSQYLQFLSDIINFSKTLLLSSIFPNKYSFPSENNLLNTETISNRLFVRKTANITCSDGQIVQCTAIASTVNFFSLDSIIKMTASVVLVGFSGLFSGLTLGLLGLDKVSLDIVAFSGSKRDKWLANKIKPIRKRGNLLLCTLLLGNVMVNTGIGVLTTELSSGFYGFIFSTVFITAFGEIIPQSFCARYALTIGAYTVWIVWIIMFFLFPLTFPISLVLDCILGKELGQIYSKKELKQLVKIHYLSPQSKIDQEESNILEGALEFSEETVSKIMTKIEDVFMLEDSTKLNMETVIKIWESGHSRIPIYKGNINNIKGILYVKDLILVNPEEEVTVSSLLGFYGRNVRKVSEDTNLDDILQLFKTGQTHMGIVVREIEENNGKEKSKKKNKGKEKLNKNKKKKIKTQNVGVVTLEDVIEEIIRDEIVDETDKFIDNTQGVINKYRKGNMFNIFYFKHFDINQKDAIHKIPNEVLNGITIYLMQTYECFYVLGRDFTRKLIKSSELLQINPKTKNNNKEEEDDSKSFLYKKGEESNFFCLNLDGKIEVQTGKDKFSLILGPWSTIGIKSLMEKEYYPDFSSKIIKTVKILKIEKEKYVEIAKKAFLEKDNLFLPEGMDWVFNSNEEFANDENTSDVNNTDLSYGSDHQQSNNNENNEYSGMPTKNHK